MNKKVRVWRSGFGFAQIIAMLLVVIPTLAFIVILLTDYWGVMRVDNNLILISNIMSRALDNEQNITDVASSSMYKAALKNAASICPNHTSIQLVSQSPNPSPGTIDVTVSYGYKSRYFNKNLQAHMITYSYQDQNRSIKYICK